jgi:hypothetical protein
MAKDDIADFVKSRRTDDEKSVPVRVFGPCRIYTKEELEEMGITFGTWQSMIPIKDDDEQP